MKLNCINTLFKKNHKIALRSLAIAIFALFLIMSTGNEAHAGQYGHAVLALYKSADGYKDTNNPIKWYFEKDINKLGLRINYHDFNDSIPDIDSLENTRAILTWYNNGLVADKKTAIAYINFLCKAADRGIKIIIVNSFGAYGYKEDGKEKWDLVSEVNKLFVKLGFALKGYWTNDPAKLRVIQKDSRLVEWQDKQDVNRSKHFQKIVPLMSDIKTYLTVKRIDAVPNMGNGSSSIIFTSSRGGFALESYVTTGQKLLLNPEPFLHESLFYDDHYQNIAIIVGDLNNRQKVIRNLSYACNYAKIDFSLFNADSLRSMIKEDFTQFEAILIAVDKTDSIPVNFIKEYVRNGGNVIFIKYADLNADFKNLVGIKYYESNPSLFKGGFTISPHFFINNVVLSGEKIGLSVRRTSLKDVKILASLKNPDFQKSYPVLWERKIGKGTILFWNTDLLFESKGMRGTIVQSIHYLHKGFVSGLVNVGLLHIDDFPAPWWNVNYREYRKKYYAELLQKTSDPVYRNKIEKIMKNLEQYPNQTDTDFIKNIWVKDLIYFKNKFGFNYSTFLIFNYNKDVSKDKNLDTFSIHDFYLARDGLSVKIGKSILNRGWELGLHGYNHMSLSLYRPKEYASEPWPDKDSMLLALKTSRKEWEKIYSKTNLPFSYVAPHNIIDNSGLAALGEAFPSIKVVSTLYIGSQGEIEQEFEWTANRRFFQIPRITSGYHLNHPDRYNMYDAIHNFGYIGHFIHPDDVFDENRSSGFSGWNWLKGSFDHEFSSIKSNFPWFRWMTTKDAYAEFLFYLSTSIRVKQSGKLITVESSDGSHKFIFFRLSLHNGQRIQSTKNCSLVHANYASGDLIFKTNKHISTIVLQ